MPGSVTPAAPGYPQYSGSIWVPPHFSRSIIDRFYHETYLREITTTELIGELRGKGDIAHFAIEPEIKVRKAVKDGTTVYDTIEPATMTLTIDQMLDWGGKIDQYDNRNLRADFEMVMRNGAARALDAYLERQILGYMYTNVHPANAGSAAGVVQGNVNLGQVGAPVVVSSGLNLRTLVARLRNVLNQQATVGGDRFIILPFDLEQVAMASDEFMLIGNQGGYDPSIAERGRQIGMMYGFKVYVSPYVPSGIDPITAQPVSWIVAGYRRATAFATVEDNFRVIDGDKDNPWDIYVTGRTAYGFGAIYPQLLATAYVHVDPAAL